MAVASTAAIVGTAVSVAATAAGTGASFGRAAKQKRAAKRAQEAAAKAYKEAHRTLINPYEALSVHALPFEQAREAGLVAAKEAMTTATQADQRGIAATAGRVQAGLTKQQADVSAEQSKKMEAIDKLIADENAYLEQERRRLFEAEAKGYQEEAAYMEKARQQSLSQGFEGLTGLVTEIAGTAPLYGGGEERRMDRQLGKAMEKGGVDFEKGFEGVDKVLTPEQLEKFNAIPAGEQGGWIMENLDPEQKKRLIEIIGAGGVLPGTEFSDDIGVIPDTFG